MGISTDESICRKCNYLIDDLVKALLEGCPVCNHRRFKLIKKSVHSKNPFQETITDTFSDTGMTVGIKVLKKGTFQLDLKALTENNETVDPIIVQDNEGVINIILDSE